MKNNKKWGALIVGTIMAIVLWGYGYFKYHPAPQEQPMLPVVAVSTQKQPLRGQIELNSTTWQGVIVDSTECVDAKNLTDNVWWEMRLDKDDGRIFRLYPRNWNEKSILKIPDSKGANIVEWRIVAGQALTHGTLVYALHKKSEPHLY